MKAITKKLIIFWSLLIICHLTITATWSHISPDSPNPGLMALYVTTVALSKLGLPVFINSHSGWGWPTPNTFGWSLAIAIWLLGYCGLALALSRIIPEKSK